MDRVQSKDGLEAILAPRSVAVVGASPDPDAVGHALLKSILDGGFAGPVYPIHPRAPEVLGLRAWRSVLDLPAAPDLAVIAVPAAAVLEVAEACGQKGVRGLVVVSAGFREADAEGAAREQALVETLRRHRMRMVGPNCLGVLNAAPAVRLHATFAPRPVLPGSTAIVTQSGAVGIALLEHAAHVGLGVARFVSMGNKADVSGNDLLMLWEDDPDVQQMLLYLENFGNPRNFVRIARRLTRTKPVTVIKGGRTATGAKAAGSHTGALMESDLLVDALLEQCGVLRAQSVEEFFDVATALATQPPMAGNRVAVVTNSGGPAILAIDALDAAGLQAAEPSPATWARLKPHIPPASHAANPLDLLAGGTPEAFEAALAALQDDPGVDAVVAIWTPLSGLQVAQAQAIARSLAAPRRKPGVAVTFGHGPGTPAFEALKAAKVPVYTFPESAVRSLAALRQVGAWRARPDEPPATPKVDRDAARAILAQARPLAGGWLPMQDAFRLLQAYGLRLPRHAWVHTPEEAARAAETLGFPAVLKLEAPGLVHKTEAGAVRLGLATAAAVADAHREAGAALARRGLHPTAAVVMETVPQAPEILAGATQDPLFGPVVACGTGGIYTEVLKDVRFRLAPLSEGGAQRMVASLRGHALLAGARGAPPADIPALEDALTRIAQLAADLPEVLELDVNPLRVLPAGQGATAIDARIRVADRPG